MVFDGLLTCISGTCHSSQSGRSARSCFTSANSLWREWEDPSVINLDDDNDADADAATDKVFLSFVSSLNWEERSF